MHILNSSDLTVENVNSPIDLAHNNALVAQKRAPSKFDNGGWVQVLACDGLGDNGVVEYLDFGVSFRQYQSGGRRIPTCRLHRIPVLLRDSGGSFLRRRVKPNPVVRLVPRLHRTQATLLELSKKRLVDPLTRKGLDRLLTQSAHTNAVVKSGQNGTLVEVALTAGFVKKCGGVRDGVHHLREHSPRRYSLELAGVAHQYQAALCRIDMLPKIGELRRRGLGALVNNADGPFFEHHGPRPQP